MKCKIISVGEKSAQWVGRAIDHYLPLVNRYVPCQLQQLKSHRLSQKQSADDVKTREAASILDAHHPQAQLIVLDERGKNWSTQELAAHLTDWKQQGLNTEFIIGGTEGLDPTIVKKAHYKWALSRLTLPHQMVRVIVLEQLFRALSINANHPYHR